MVYEVLVTTPFKDSTIESEYMSLIEDMMAVGYSDSTMGTHGYTFELIAPLNMSPQQFKNEVRDIVDYYGLIIADISFIGY